MATQKFSHLSAKSKITAIGRVTTTGSIANVGVIAVPFDNAMLVMNVMDLTGTLTVTVTGNTAADGSGTHTVIKTVAFPSTDTAGSVEVDSSEVSYAQDAAATTFLSVVFRITGTNTDTLEAATQVVTMRQYENQTPTGNGVTT